MSECFTATAILRISSAAVNKHSTTAELDSVDLSAQMHSLHLNNQLDTALMLTNSGKVVLQPSC